MCCGLAYSIGVIGKHGAVGGTPVHDDPDPLDAAVGIRDLHPGQNRVVTGGRSLEEIGQSIPRATECGHQLGAAGATHGLALEQLLQALPSHAESGVDVEIEELVSRPVVVPTVGT
jgi:hypothetical protein